MTLVMTRPASTTVADGMDLMPIRFGRAVCGDLTQAERREWWLANGLGAYAAGTIAGSLTRRYHGLLVAPVEPPLGRRLVFAKADATLIADGREWPLFTNRWASGALAPTGHEHAESFHLDRRIPVWTYAVAGRRVEARVWLEQGKNTVTTAWRLHPDAGDGDGVALRVTLLVNGRDHHGTTDRHGFNPDLRTDAPDRLRVVEPGGFTLTLHAPSGRIEPRRDWHADFLLPIEEERGLAPVDHHLCVGDAVFNLRPGQWVGVVGSLEAEADTDIPASLARRRAQEAAVLDSADDALPEMADAPGWVRRLVLACDSFLFARPLPGVPDGQSVIAGYPWFGDWGRDTMIALPGLTLATGRADSARRILETFARFVDHGMLPNVFPGAGERADYNTVDAALWYVEAWRAYVEATGDLDALARTFPVLADIIDWHRRGTRYGIGEDPADGLLRAGEPGLQLTWMDAKIGDWVVTPRHGKPVEINALWFNALRAMAGFADRLGRPAGFYVEAAEKVRCSFTRFIRPQGGLYDVIDGPDGDATIRPNQIFAVSLPFSPLEPAVQARVVAECRRELLTSHGLRSLAPDHPDYRGHYHGGVWERDGGYHQGPVWAWLIGPFALAVHRVTGDADAAQRLLEPIADHLTDAALGQVSEIFDGAPPHTPRGCPVQAWSAACVLEAWWRLEQTKSSNGRT
ncbi:amylo-alpha-1,6-glucosidase [Azospirillum canadense]|uniref:amylo-alpha-1,6-glucosidase n=1 Tax=Azospirillum canadense TaxID=403962 RepID=UPI0022271D14|nr:amylo-alpha-1,6-glucosidase [Azospirillum canadense]MCW2244050.1 4-alpha-glucanotransferase [Azospirillum canadense]